VPPGPATQRVEQLRSSRWFTRGWTLQKLIAPAQVFFVDRDWKVVETKNSFYKDVHAQTRREPLSSSIPSITGIPRDVLGGTSKIYLGHYGVAQRMGRAANRPVSGQKTKPTVCWESSPSTSHFFVEKAVSPSNVSKKNSYFAEKAVPFLYGGHHGHISTRASFEEALSRSLDLLLLRDQAT
jgi:hypothetical protein